jgi:hypothetical protein
MLGELMVATWKEIEMPPLELWDGGIDLVSALGNRVQVKASPPKYPELMVPGFDRWKVERVDVLVKTVVDLDAMCGKITCWQWAQRFLGEARTDGDYPIADTMYLEPGDGSLGTAYTVGLEYTFPPAVQEAMQRRADVQTANSQTAEWASRWREW